MDILKFLDLNIDMLLYNLHKNRHFTLAKFKKQNMSKGYGKEIEKGRQEIDKGRNRDKIL